MREPKLASCTLFRDGTVNRRIAKPQLRGANVALRRGALSQLWKYPFFQLECLGTSGSGVICVAADLPADCASGSPFYVGSVIPSRSFAAVGIPWLETSLMPWYQHPFFRHHTTRNVFALLEDALLVAVVILCSKLVGLIIDWTIAPGFFHDALASLKGFGSIVLYCWFFAQLLFNLYNLTKGKSDGSHSLLAA